MVSLPPIPRKYKAVVLGGVALVVVFVVSAVFGSRGLLHLRAQQQKQRALEALAFRLEQRNERIRTHLERLEQDDAYVERLARERLGWIKDGEIVYRVDGASARWPGGGRAGAAGSRVPAP